jgi:hypothetical protein
MPRLVGDVGRHLGAVLERVASVEHEVGDRFPRCPDPEDPHASRGWSTPKLILPKRGVWERHADANWFCRGYQFRTLLQWTTPATGPAVVARPPESRQLAEATEPGGGRPWSSIISAGLPRPLSHVQAGWADRQAAATSRWQLAGD